MRLYALEWFRLQGRRHHHRELGKSGTTWVQQIIAELIFGGAPDLHGAALSPWMEMPGIPGPALLGMVAAQTHRRFLKTHLPVSALVFSPRARYVYVGRDARDVIWSYYNHVAGYTPEQLERMNAPADLGPPVGWPRGNERQFYLDFLEDPRKAHQGAWPFWESVREWWDIRALPNVLFVHFNSLKSDLPGQIRRIAQFLDIPFDESAMPSIVEHCGIDHMREAAGRNEMLKAVWKDGGRTLVNKGTNDRWRDVLSANEAALADEAAARSLASDCAHWLRTGELPA